MKGRGRCAPARLDVDMEQKRFEYTINSDDVITSVNEDWSEFADQNDAEGLGHRVVGTWLWQHFSGREVKQLFQVLLDRVRERGLSVTVPFRCDAPDLRRHMVVEVAPLEDRAIRFSSWIETEEVRSKVHLLSADRSLDPGGLLRMCAWCKRVDVGSGDSDGTRPGSGVWREVEEALGELALLEVDSLPRITHAVCRDCRQVVLEGYDAAG